MNDEPRKRLRILIAGFHTLPGISGGWATPVDLLGSDHELTYAVNRGRRGAYTLEGVNVRCSRLALPTIRKGIVQRFVHFYNLRVFARHLRTLLREQQFDCLLCQDLIAAYCAKMIGCRYILRLHDYPEDRRLYQHVLSNAAAVTSVDPTVDEAVYVRHSTDTRRFSFSSRPTAESALLVATLNHATDPLTFVEGVARSHVKGFIYGDGYLRNEVIQACKRTKGKVQYMGAVPRLELDRIYGKHEIGVACLQRAHNPYVMKITEYQCCGVFPVVHRNTHLAAEAPHLCKVFANSEELASQIDWVAENWASLQDLLKANREFAVQHYDVDVPRRQYNQLFNSLAEQGRLAPMSDQAQ